MAHMFKSWKTEDGLVFPTQEEAEAHEAKVAMMKMVEQELGTSEVGPEEIVDFMVSHAEELVILLLRLTPRLFLSERCDPGEKDGDNES